MHLLPKTSNGSNKVSNLVLIAKKAHTISTLSTLHDRIMTRYYKFLIVNVLVFFCIGTVTLQSFLVSFSQTTGLKLISVVSDSFPSAGPFYVGWRKYWFTISDQRILTDAGNSYIYNGNSRRLWVGIMWVICSTTASKHISYIYCPSRGAFNSLWSRVSAHIS